MGKKIEALLFSRTSFVVVKMYKQEILSHVCGYGSIPIVCTLKLLLYPHRKYFSNSRAVEISISSVPVE